MHCLSAGPIPRLPAWVSDLPVSDHLEGGVLGHVEGAVTQVLWIEGRQQVTLLPRQHPMLQTYSPCHSQFSLVKPFPVYVNREWLA